LISALFHEKVHPLFEEITQMAAPNVQVSVDSNKIQAFWDLCLDGTYLWWKLYWDDEPGYVDSNVVATYIPNVADSYYSSKHVTITFPRPAVETQPLWLWVSGITPAGAVDDAHWSLQKYVPATNETDPMVKQKIFGYDPDNGIWRPIKVEKDTDPSIAGVLDVTP